MAQAQQGLRSNQAEAGHAACQIHAVSEQRQHAGHADKQVFRCQASTHACMKGQLRRKLPGAVLVANSAPSIRKVPLPHCGSTSTAQAQVQQTSSGGGQALAASEVAAAGITSDPQLQWQGGRPGVGGQSVRQQGGKKGVE